MSVAPLRPLRKQEIKDGSFSLTWLHVGVRDPPGPGTSPDLPGADSGSSQSSRRNQNGDPGSNRGKHTAMDVYLIRFYLKLFYIVEFVLQDSIQVHLKASQGPITILTCELGPSRPMETTACFLGLEESRIRTKTHTPGLELLLVYWLFLLKSKNSTF